MQAVKQSQSFSRNVGHLADLHSFIHIHTVYRRVNHASITHTCIHKYIYTHTYIYIHTQMYGGVNRVS